MLDTFRTTDNQTISTSGLTRCALFSERKYGRKILVAICDPRSSSALVERPHTACRLRNLADFIFSTTTTMTVDDVGLYDSSRTHISQRVRSCGNFDIPEYSVSEKERGRERERGEILCVLSKKLRFSVTRVIFSAIAIYIPLIFSLSYFSNH